MLTLHVITVCNLCTLLLTDASCNISSSDPPSVSMTVCRDTISSGQACSITCQVSEGNPPQSTLSWFFQRKFENDFVRLEHLYDVMMFTATNNSAGTYRCQAANDEGSSVDQKELLVTCKLRRTVYTKVTKYS